LYLINTKDQRRVALSCNTNNERRSQSKEVCTSSQNVQIYSSADLAEVFEDWDGFWQENRVDLACYQKEVT